MTRGTTEGVVVEERTVAGEHGGVRVRDHRPIGSSPAGVPLVWLHGGGFSEGGLDQRESDAPARSWAGAPIGARLVRTVDYRLARRPPLWRRSPAGLPDRHPAALHDVVAATLDLAAEHGAVLIGGASAGACLAAAATLHLQRRGGRLPIGLLLAYGTFHAALPADPEVEAQLRGPRRLLFNAAMVRTMHLNYVGDPALLVPGTAFPGGADLTGFPPALLLDADNDRLRASGTAFARELSAAGVAAEHEVLPGSVHGFLNTPSRAAFAAGTARIATWCGRFDARPALDEEDSTR